MTGLREHEVVLTIFGLCFVVLMAGIIHVLWRRIIRFRLQNVSEKDSDMSRVGASKELLFFFFWKNQSSRVEADAKPPLSQDVQRDSEAAEDDDLEKWRAMCGPPRLLYTIKEEEKEGRDSTEYSTESQTESRWTSRDLLAARLSTEATLDAIEEVEGATPYYTPSPSPDHLV